MKIGRVGGAGPSRREMRRQREDEQARQEQDRAADRREVKPAIFQKRPAPAKGVPLPSSDLMEEERSLGGKLPGQKGLFAKNIRVRHLADLSVGISGWEEAPDVRRTVIEDIDDQGRLFLAQTSPPVLQSQAGRAVRLSFLDRYHDVPGGRWLRVGYETAILEVLKNHPLSSTLKADVVVVEGPRRLEQVSTRSAFRLAPPREVDLRLEIMPDGDQVGLMDISYTGARFYHDQRWRFSPGRTMGLALKTGGLVLPLSARVVRQDDIRDRWGEEHGVTCVSFVHNDPAVLRDLMRLLTEVYRFLLARRSGVQAKRDK